MTTNDRDNPRNSPRILMFSQRNIYKQAVWRCAFYEFEELLQEIDSVTLLAPKPRKWYKNGTRAAFRLGRHFTTPLNPGVTQVKLDRYYDLFLAVCELPSDLLHLTAVKGWKDHCKTSVCWVTEFYVNWMSIYKSCLEVLSQFDHVVFMFNMSQPFRNMIKGKGSYLAPGIDAIRFCPYPLPPARSIDVLSIGRRSEQTHQALLRMAEEKGLFYVYDTISDLGTHNLAEHRALLANMAKRSRYFIVNPGKIDRPQETGGQSEFGARYFEGAASGAILIGERPTNNKEFDRIFHWPDAVIDLPFGSEETDAIIAELDAQPERQINIRQKNVVQSLLHHDWAYRWDSILATAGLGPLPELVERKRRLSELAARVEEQADMQSVTIKQPAASFI